jgi:polysaccharide deacetylase/chitobiase/beta-hexosaminidase-like protein
MAMDGAWYVRGRLRRSHWLAVVLVCVLGVPVAAVLAHSAPAVASTTTQPVAGTLDLRSVACASVTACEALGDNSSGSGAVAVPVTNGIPGSVKAASGTGTPGGIACPTASGCLAVGSDSSRSRGVLLPITSDIPGSPQPVPGTNWLGGVACSTASSCEVVGDLETPSNSEEGVVVSVTGGTPGSAQPVPGTVVLGDVACTSSTSCLAVGNNYSSSTGWQGIVLPITNGVPGSPQPVPGVFELNGVACASATACVAVGQNSTSQGVIVPINGGTPSSVRVVAGTQSLKGVACSGGTCEAVGANPPGPPGSARGVLVPIFNGTTGAVQTVPGTRILYSIACPGVTSCQAVGDDAMGEGVVATVTIQTIVSLTFDNGAISQYTLGYKQAVAPHGVSATFYINTGVIGGANHMSWSQLSAVAAAGQEIGGKTVDGTNLTTQSTSQQVAEICNDRQALLSHGLKPAGFAYPAGAFNTTLESEVQSCGYGNARTAGSLSPAGPTYAEPLPPKYWLAMRAYAPSGRVTLANLESLVTGAASYGGGWVPIVIQKVCSQALDPNNYATCTASSGWIELADLNSILSWVQNAGQPGGAPASATFSPIGATAAAADTTAPATTIACNGASCAATPYGGTVSVTLSATDAGSGIASTHYTTDGSTPTLSSPTYTGAFPLTSSATVKYRSWDNAGNAEPTESQAIQM